MKLQIETSIYNEKRYGKPWIAVVKFDNAKGEFKFGEWAGQHGYEGILILDAEAGSIVARGQKDFRKPRNSAPDFYIITDTGELQYISKKDAYLHYNNRSK